MSDNRYQRFKATFAQLPILPQVILKAIMLKKMSVASDLRRCCQGNIPGNISCFDHLQSEGVQDVLPGMVLVDVSTGNWHMGYR